jgi:hypothetical protein
MLSHATMLARASSHGAPMRALIPKWIAGAFTAARARCSGTRVSGPWEAEGDVASCDLN